jgi:hypothetical protein
MKCENMDWIYLAQDASNRKHGLREHGSEPSSPKTSRTLLICYVAISLSRTLLHK